MCWVLPQLLVPGRTRKALGRCQSVRQWADSGHGDAVDSVNRDTGCAELVRQIDLHGPAPPHIAASSWRGGGCSWERDRPYAPVHQARNRLNKDLRRILLGADRGTNTVSGDLVRLARGGDDLDDIGAVGIELRPADTWNRKQRSIIGGSALGDRQQRGVG